jgi:hypothetical protein
MQLLGAVAQADVRVTVQHVDAVVVGMLIEAGVTARLHAEVAQVEVRRGFVLSDQDLAAGRQGRAILRPIGP